MLCGLVYVRACKNRMCMCGVCELFSPVSDVECCPFYFLAKFEQLNRHTHAHSRCKKKTEQRPHSIHIVYSTRLDVSFLAVGISNVRVRSDRSERLTMGMSSHHSFGTVIFDIIIFEAIKNEL